MEHIITYTPFLFDFWSAIHFGFWAFVASTVGAIKEPPLKIHFIYTIIGSLAWEVAEYFASRHWPATWGYHLETLTNSFIGDPISNLAGATFGWFVVAFYRKHYWVWRKPL